jgi:hypothetical protein
MDRGGAVACGGDGWGGGWGQDVGRGGEMLWGGAAGGTAKPDRAGLASGAEGAEGAGLAGAGRVRVPGPAADA